MEILIGTWQKAIQTECSEKYPDHIEFRVNQLYFATSNPHARLHPVWDSGRYSCSEGSLRMSTSNDSIQVYQVQFGERQFIITDKENCTCTFKKK